MRKLIAVLVLSLSSVGASAGGHGHFGSRYYHNQHNNHHNRNDWIAPLIVGGVITYAITRPQPQVIVQQPQVVQQVPYGYHYENVLDANCNCYRLVLVPN